MSKREKPKYDKRRKYYLILDCESATVPFVVGLTEEQKKVIAINKPLIYDLGWQVVDNQGRVYAKKSFLIAEIFSVPQIFNTAYYASKRNIYLERLANGETTLTSWASASAELVADMMACEAVGAYNSMFDFKKALPFTETYISKLYSPDLQTWLQEQERICEWFLQGNQAEGKNDFEPRVFRFRGETYNLFDLWGLTCEHILNCDEYKQMCIDNEWSTASGKYFKTSAETAFRFVSKDLEFIEAHTAIDDVIIESQLFAMIVKATKRKWEMGITAFPFRTLGTVANYMAQKNS